MPRELLSGARGSAVRPCAKHGRGFICWAAAGRCGDELITMALLDTRLAPRGGYLKRDWSGSGERRVALLLAAVSLTTQFNFHAI